jgi:hypothetical protein
MKDAIETMQGANDVQAHIVYTDDPMNPRLTCDNVCTMWCWHRRYTLGDKHKHDDLTAAVVELWQDYSTEDERKQFVQDWMKSLPLKEVKKYCNRIDLMMFDKQDRFHHLFEGLLYAKRFITEIRLPSRIHWLPLFLYDHSGISISTGSFGCRWDSGLVGFIWTADETARNEWLESEVATYDQYLRGDQYDVIVKHGGEVIAVNGPHWTIEDARFEATQVLEIEQEEETKWTMML